jgi:hypothetical protein
MPVGAVFYEQQVVELDLCPSNLGFSPYLYLFDSGLFRGGAMTGS